MTNGETGLRAWATAFALAAVALLACLAYVVALDQLDNGRAVAPSGVQVAWWVCLVVAVGSALAAGVVGGLVRGVIVTVALWTIIVVGIRLLLGPTCPLAGIFSEAPRGLPPIRFGTIYGDVFCSVSGTSARSTAARGVAYVGGAATLLTALGAVVTTTRSLRRRAALPAS